MKAINIIFVIKNGVVKTPFATTDDVVAEAHFDNLSHELLGDEYDYILGNKIDYETKLVVLNNYLNNLGISVEWFIEIDVV